MERNMERKEIESKLIEALDLEESDFKFIGEVFFKIPNSQFSDVSPGKVSILVAPEFFSETQLKNYLESNHISTESGRFYERDSKWNYTRGNVVLYATGVPF